MAKKNLLQSKYPNPFGELIGLKFNEVKNGSSQCIIEVNEKLLNPLKIVHGGVIYSMADTGMPGALYSVLEKNETCTTIEVKINYFKTVSSGIVTCNSKVIHKGKKIAVTEAEILGNNEIIAKAIGTYSIFNLK